MTTRDADAIVVGAGIQGAAVAYEMARRGLRALVVERNRPGHGNSRASFGILHGGLRYLQRLDFARWRRSRQEQAWFARLFAAEVEPLNCLMPLYRGGVRRPALFALAFALQRLLDSPAGTADTMPTHGRLLGRQSAASLPIRHDGLIDVACWSEFVLSDVIAVIDQLLAAATHRTGSQLLIGDVHALRVQRGAVSGLSVLLDGRPVELHAPQVIVCAGAGSRALLQRFGYEPPQLSSATLAFNLLLDVPAPSGVALALSPQPARGRSLFFRGERGRLLAGTWYAPAPALARAGSAAVAPQLIEQAVAEVRECLPQLRIDRSLVVDTRAGLLPDRDGSGRSLRERDVLLEHRRTGGPAGLWSVLGTKLTTARALAACAVARAWPQPRGRQRAAQPPLWSADAGGE